MTLLTNLALKKSMFKIINKLKVAHTKLLIIVLNLVISLII